MGKIFQVVVDGLRGTKMTIDLCNTEEQMRNMTVLQLKEKIVKRVPSIEKEALRLIFADKHLDNDNTILSDCGIQHLSIIRVTLRVPGGLFA